MTPDEVEERLAAAHETAARCVSAVHDAIVVEVECVECGAHVVMVCDDCEDDDPAAVNDECPHVAALVGALGAGRVIA
jgi:hypothetical protein